MGDSSRAIWLQKGFIRGSASGSSRGALYPKARFTGQGLLSVRPSRVKVRFRSTMRVLASRLPYSVCGR
jgi:hypothetical protein